MFKKLFTNWKTTLAGILTALAALNGQFHWIPLDQAAAVAAAATSFGLLAAKDGNVTGGTKQQ